MVSSRLPGEVGLGLCSAIGPHCKLSFLPGQGYRMGSKACKTVWLETQTRQTCWMRPLACWGYHPGSTDGQMCWLRAILEHCCLQQCNIQRSLNADFLTIPSGLAFRFPHCFLWGKTQVGPLESVLQCWESWMSTLGSVFPLEKL